MQENQSTRVRDGDEEVARCEPSCVAGKGVGVVLIGDILLEYRYSYANAAGAADLDAFLRALGVKKV